MESGTTRVRMPGGFQGARGGAGPRWSEAQPDAEALADARYREVVLESAEARWVQRGGRILLANRAFASLLGYGEPAVLQDRPALDLLHPPPVDPEVRERTARLLDGEESGGLHGDRWTRAAGDHLPVEFTASRVRYAGDEAWEITARDASEREQLGAELLQSQKLEAVGRMAGGIAHDFNNLLTAMAGYSELLLDELPAGGSRECAEEIRRATERASALTRQLLAFSRRQVLSEEIIDPNQLIRDTSRMLRRLIGTDVELETRLAPDLGAVRADRSQLEQVLLNLAVNARDAMPEGGRLLVETANLELDERAPQLGLPLPPGEYVSLAVADNGVGMDEITRERIFEPFFTTKERGKGTGLGLSTVYGIVRQSGGAIKVSSRKGRGTVFLLALPRVHRRPEVQEPPPVPRDAPRGHETILLVEDDEDVRRLVRRMLERLDYRVIEAREAGEAFEVAAHWGQPVDLLVTDVVMPNVSGVELGRRMRARDPDLRVLYISGYSEDTTLEARLSASDEEAFLAKPFSAVGLGEKVRALLDARPVRRAQSR